MMIAAAAAGADSAALLHVQGPGLYQPVASWPEWPEQRLFRDRYQALEALAAARPAATACLILPVAFSQALGGRPVTAWCSGDLGGPAAGHFVVLLWRKRPERVPAPALLAAVTRAGRRLMSRTPEVEINGSRDQLFARILELMPMGMVYVDEAAGLALPNRRARDLLVLGDGAVSTRALAEAMREMVDAALNAGDAAATIMSPPEDEGSVRRVELRFPDERVVALTGVAFASEALAGRVWLLQDITEAQRMAMRVAEASRLETVGEVAGGVAHQFNNLLATIRADAENLLCEWPRGAAEAEDLARIVEATERGAILVGNLLTYARRQVLLPRLIDPAEAVIALVNGMAESWDDVTLTLADLPQKRPFIRVDPGLYRLALSALLSNAREAAAPDGDVGIGIQLRVDSAARDGAVASASRYVVEIVVSDNGDGMDEKARQRAFDPFFTTREGHVGLGLSLALGFARDSGGGLELASHPTAGTEVRLTLPAAEGQWLGA